MSKLPKIKVQIIIVPIIYKSLRSVPPRGVNVVYMVLRGYWLLTGYCQSEVNKPGYASTNVHLSTHKAKNSHTLSNCNLQIVSLRALNTPI